MSPRPPGRLSASCQSQNVPLLRTTPESWFGLTTVTRRPCQTRADDSNEGLGIPPKWFRLRKAGGAALPAGDAVHAVFDAGDFQGFRGGPTLLGAWAVHLALGLRLVVAFPFELWRAGRRDRSLARRGAGSAISQAGPRFSNLEAWERSCIERRNKR
jgi:hypothetical protein